MGRCSRSLGCPWTYLSQHIGWLVRTILAHMPWTSLILKIYFYLCLCICECVTHLCWCWCYYKTEEGLRSGTGVTKQLYVTRRGYRKPNFGLLEKQQALFNHRLISLALTLNYICWWKDWWLPCLKVEQGCWLFTYIIILTSKSSHWIVHFYIIWR